MFPTLPLIFPNFLIFKLNFCIFSGKESMSDFAKRYGLDCAKVKIRIMNTKNAMRKERDKQAKEMEIDLV